MLTIASRRLSRFAGYFVLQAALWVVLTLAFAILSEVAGLSWDEALYFSALSWLPWIAIAPAVFWLATRFRLERGHLWRSVPIHAIACLSCSILAVGWSAYFAPSPRLGTNRPGFNADVRGSEPRPLGMRKGKTWHAPEKFPPREPVDLGEGAPVDSSADSGAPVMGTRAPGPRGPDWWRTRDPLGRAAMGRGLRDRGPFRGPGSGPPPPTTGVPGVIRRWAFLGSFWPRFSSTLLRVNFNAVLYLIIVSVAHTLGYYRSAKDRESQALALTAGLNRAKLDALRLQLHPHFLFNTLNAISTLVHRSPDAADELIADLSELLRLSLQTGEHEVPLARELELLECYLAIEQTRLGPALRIVRDIDPTVRAILVPTFVLQTLAENAIRHGLEPRTALGTLTISAHRDREKLCLVVADDGVGIGAISGTSPRRGVGLANTEQRIRALYGADAQLEIVAPPAGGVEVRLLLPLRTTPSSPPPAPEAA